MLKGSVVVDVGAGTGLMLEEFSKGVGRRGRVLALELSPQFCEFMIKRSIEEGLENVSVIQCGDTGTNLPPGCADVAFICDVYHHFEYPLTFMRDLHRSLRPGGMVVLVDFHRDPSKMVNHSPQWALEHIRAGQDVFRAEIEAAGFEFVNQVDIPELKENYCIVFRRRGEEDPPPPPPESLQGKTQAVMNKLKAAFSWLSR